jgi:hypothetical protein
MRTPAAASLLSAILLGVSVASPGTAHAQSRRDAVAYFAMLNTPAGTLPASSYGADVGVAPRTVDVLYGRMNFESGSMNNFAVGYGAGSGRSRFGVQAGVTSCDACDGVAILRVESEVLLAHAGTEGGTFGLGLQPAIGLGRVLDSRAEGFAVTATVGFPVSVTGGGQWRTTVFVTPAVGAGTFTAADADAIGWRPLIGGGVRVRGAHGMGFLASAQRVLIRDAGETLLGFSIAMPVGGR